MQPPVDARKTVLFLDDQGWDSFEQMAIGLRRRGVRAVRVTTSPPARAGRLLKEPHFRWLADRLCYDELVDIGSEAGRRRLLDLMETGAVADVVANEPALLAVGLQSPLGEALTGRALAFHGTPPQTLLDKFAVNAALAAAGMATPRQVRVRDTTPAEAVARLGLPLWIKHPIGASGERVRVARDASEIPACLRDLGEDGDGLFFQENALGTVLVYGAVVGPDGVVMEQGFRIVRPQREGGPAAKATLSDEPTLLAAGRRASAVLGARGFVSCGFVEAADGRLLHIAANVRPWGTITAALGLGVDFAEAYAAMVSGRKPKLPERRPVPDQPLPVLPQGVLGPAEAGQAGATIAGAGALLRTFAGPLGLPYCGYILARAPLLAMRGLKRRRAGRDEVADAAARPVAAAKGAASSTLA